jgi:hypothetical protein
MEYPEGESLRHDIVMIDPTATAAVLENLLGTAPVETM